MPIKISYTNSSPLHSPKEYKKVTNQELDLEGALEFNGDKNSMIVLDKKLTDIHKISRRDFRPPRVETFTSFIQAVIKILHTYDDDTFEDFFQIVDKEIRKYQYKGFKFQELTDDYEIRNLLTENINLLKGKSIHEVAEIIKHKVNDKNVKQLLTYINSVYKEDAREKFRKILTDLEAYGDSNNKVPKTDLAKIIRNGIRAIVFDHYTNLDAKQRRELKKEFIVFLKGLTEITSASSNANFISPKPNISKDITSEVKNPDILKKSDPLSTTVYNKVESKRHYIHRPKSRNDLSANEETMLTTSDEENDSQQLVLTFVSADETFHDSNENNYKETSIDESSDESFQESNLELFQEQYRKMNAQPYDGLYIEDFYNTTKNSTNRQPTSRSNIKRLRHRTTAKPASKQNTKVIFRRARPSQTTSRFLNSDDNDNMNDKDFRRSIAPIMSDEELSGEVFDRERRQREEALAESYSFVSNNSIQHGLKDYIKRRKHLDKTVNELMKIQENNQRSRVNVTTFIVDKVKNAANDFEAKDKIHKDKSKPIDGEYIKETRARARSESNKNKVRNTSDVVTETNIFNKDEQAYENSKGWKEGNAFKLEKPKKVKGSGLKDATKAETTGTGSIEAVYTLSKLLTSVLESAKIPVLFELLPTTKEESNPTETTSKATIEVDNATLNVNEEIIIKKNSTTVDIDEDTHKYEARAQTEENENEERDSHDGINVTNLFNKDEQEYEHEKEPVKRQDQNGIKLMEQKKVRSGSMKSTKTQTTGTRYKYSTEEMKTSSKLHTTTLHSIKIPVLSELQPTAKENKNLTETTSKATTEDHNANLNVNEKAISKTNATTVVINEDTRGKLNLYVVVTPSTRRPRRVLQYSSPPFY